MRAPEIEVRDMDTAALAPYANNAKLHDSEQVGQIAASIREFGFNDPVAVWQNEDGQTEIVEGHGRVLAAQRLGIGKVPVFYLNHLSDEQRRAYTHVHNQTTLSSGWDTGVLEAEIEALDFDWVSFGFDLPSPAPLEEPDEGFYGDERLRNDNEWHLELCDRYDCEGPFELPPLEPAAARPPDLIGFNFCMSATDFSPGVHFCIDDYQFERVWRRPERYLDLLRKFDCVVCPDFSVYTNMPYPMRLWNIYRSRMLGFWWQRMGLTVVPNVTFSDESSWDYCFSGLPRHSTIFVSTVGAARDADARELCLKGLAAMIPEVEPERVLLLGSDLGFDFGGAEVVGYRPTAFR